MSVLQIQNTRGWWRGGRVDNPTTLPAPLILTMQVIQPNLTTSLRTKTSSLDSLTSSFWTSAWSSATTRIARHSRPPNLSSIHLNAYSTLTTCMTPRETRLTTHSRNITLDSPIIVLRRINIKCFQLLTNTLVYMRTHSGLRTSERGKRVPLANPLCMRVEVLLTQLLTLNSDINNLYYSLLTIIRTLSQYFMPIGNKSVVCLEPIRCYLGSLFDHAVDLVFLPEEQCINLTLLRLHWPVP